MRIAIGLAAAVAAVAAFAGPRADVAVACSCAAVDPARSLARVDAAFVGTVLSRRVEHPQAPIFSSADPAFLTFRVERAVKGTLPDRLVVKTAAESASCGLELQRGQRVGLLLSRHGSRYLSGLCSQVAPDHLARFAVPTARVIAGPADHSSWLWWAVGAAAGALTALVGGGVAYRRLHARTDSG